ncbi:MAG: hypothetical protein PWQ70_786 [Clostridiales bacterium]|nr:hypothetical protein [Clostridiales bacterium]
MIQYGTVEVESNMSIIKKILINITFLFKRFFFLTSKLILWGMEQFKIFEFRKVFILIVPINLIISIILVDKNSLLISSIRVFLAIILLLLSFTAFYSIQSKKKILDREKYLSYMLDWSITWIFISNATFMYFVNISNELAVLVQYLTYIGLFLMMHYWLRRFVSRHIKHWISYSVYFSTLPLIAGIIWIIFGDILAVSFNMPELISDKVIGYMTIVLTVILLNFEIYDAPKEIRPEVRVAVNFIVAMYSTISYCFFISDYLTEPLYNILIPLESEFVEHYGEFSRQMIKLKVENFIKWVTLPYLIGAVFGCFLLELLDRNDYMSNKKKENELHNEQTDW